MRARTLVLSALVIGLAGVGWAFRDRLVHVVGPASGDKPQAAAAAKPSGGRPGGAQVAVVTVAAESGTFPIRRRTIGMIESPASVLVRSRVDSQILEQHFTDGQMVKAGDLLFTLDDKELRAAVARDEATLARNQALAARTKADLARVRELLARSAAAQSRLDQAVADAKGAEADVAAAEATLAANKLKLSYTRITAPMAGRMGAVRVTPGNLVSASDASGTGLVTITQIKPIRASFTLPERELPALRAALLRSPPPVRVLLPGTATMLASGKIDFLDSAVDTNSGTIIAKANFPNDDLRLWPGMFADVEIDLDMRPGTTTVPTPAVQVGQSGPYVYVVNAAKTVEARPVAIIGAEGGLTAIENGVKAGEHVVVDGQLRIATGMKVREEMRPAAVDPAVPAAPGRPAEPVAAPNPGELSNRGSVPATGSIGAAGDATERGGSETPAASGVRKGEADAANPGAARGGG